MSSCPQDERSQAARFRADAGWPRTLQAQTVAELDALLPVILYKTISRNCNIAELHPSGARERQLAFADYRGNAYREIRAAKSGTVEGAAGKP